MTKYYTTYNYSQHIGFYLSEMNGKKARKLKQLTDREFETSDDKSKRMVYQDLKTMYKKGQVKFTK